MAPHKESVPDEEPPSINPYEVLELEKTATEEEIKRAYRKSALKYHPDKVSDELKAESHTKFQEIAFAYAVLSDPTRRKRYDRTGSTSESIDADGFCWSDFYSEQYRDIVTTESIEAFANSYKRSDEEKDDLLAAYTKFQGKWGKMYQVVMLSDPIEDEERFRAIIEEAIQKKDVEDYPIFRQESQASKDKRMKKARAEAKEAAELGQKLGADKMLTEGGPSKSKGKTKKKEVGHMNDLAAMIQARQASRHGMFSHLEAKYGGQQAMDSEPSEEAFQKNRTRKAKKEPDAVEEEEEEVEAPKKSKKSKAAKPKKGKKRPIEDSEDEDDVIDLDGGEPMDVDMDADEVEAEAVEDEEEVAVPVKKAKKAKKVAAKKSAPASGTRKSKRTKSTA